MLTLDSLNDVNLTVRGMFTLSLMLSLMSVYFTLVQQRELSLPTSAETLRRWLWNGIIRNTSIELSASDLEAGREQDSKQIRESSLTSNILLQAPFELLGIAISLFLGALAAYLGLAMCERVRLGTGPSPNNEAVLIAFLICTAFTLSVFGQALGQKDREKERCKSVLEGLAIAVAPGQQPSSVDQQPPSKC